ncbi:MAG: HNH endonuclease [Chitinophagaceae bacterium]|nr:HNH endonuclease [Chitinophagaceae bacterium]
MPKSLVTPRVHRYILKHRFKMTGSDIAAHFGLSESVVHRYMRKHGLAIDKQQMYALRAQKRIGKTTFTKKEDNYIRRHYLTIPVKRIAAALGRSYTGVNNRLLRMGLTIPRHIVDQRKADSRIKPGTVPPNKGKKMPPEVYKKVKHTFFKKGHLPANTRYDGFVTMRTAHRKNGTVDHYHWVRVAKAKWIMKHVQVWERKHGPVPPGHIIIFKDGNTSNCRISNLKCINRKQHMLRNNIHNLPPQLVQAKRLLQSLNKKIKKYEEQANRP